MTRFLKSRLAWLIVIAVGLAGVLLYDSWRDGLLSEVIFSLQDGLGKGEQLRQAILSQGMLAPLLFMGLQSLQVILAPIPGEASGILGGYIFGASQGFVYSSVGLTIGSWVAFVTGRLLSDLIRQRLEHARLYHRFNHLVCGSDFVVPFVLFLLPGFPKDSLAYFLGMSHMPMPVFLFITGVGRMPGTLMLSLQGAEVSQGNWSRVLVMLGLSLLIAVPCMIWRKPLMAWLAHYGKRHFRDDPPPSPPGTP